MSLLPPVISMRCPLADSFRFGGLIELVWRSANGARNGPPSTRPMSTSGTLSPNTCRLGRLTLSKRGNRSLSNRDVLLNRSRACAYGTDNASIQRDRYAASEDDDLAGIGFLNAVKGTPRLRQLSQ